MGAEWNTERQADVAGLLSPLSDLADATATPRLGDPECRSTRAALHDYLARRLQHRRQHHLEAHMYGCAECIRAFIDLREASWTDRTVARSSDAAR